MEERGWVKGGGDRGGWVSVRELPCVEMTERAPPGTMMLVRYRLTALAFVACASSLACGPSFQAIYEGDVRFEHCYAVDESKRAPGTEKLACWHDWLTTYTYGQTADRVEYAAGRYHYLKTEGTPAGADALAEATMEHPVVRQTIGVPETTSAFVAPPNVAPAPPSALRPVPVAAPARPPGFECVDECTASWQACRSECKGGDCVRCDNSSRACMSACYGEKRNVAAPHR